MPGRILGRANMKPLLACNYAVVRFLPYRETGEFVNVGVVVFCPQSGYFDLQIETRKQGRVTDFFPELDKDLFRQGRRNFYVELKRVRELLQRDNHDIDDQARLAVFQQLVRPRESVFRFSEVATTLAEDPAAKLQELFDHFVNRQFAHGREYQETVMARRLNEFLRANQLLRFYRSNQRVGNDEFHVVLPIVSDAKNAAGIVRRAIKPLDLDRSEPTKIYEHGDLWVKRVERLRRLNLLPEGMLFALREPADGDKHVRACQEIRAELARFDVLVLAHNDETGILEFARFETN